MPITWAIITGEYPPQIGGVGDYTRALARGLAQKGDRVHVFAPASEEEGPRDPEVILHRLPGHYGLRGLAALDAALAGARCDRVLVQYVPHAYGWKAMNLAFCLLLFLRRRRAPLWVMFHEVAFPDWKKQALRYRLLAAATRLMAKLLARAAERIFVSIPGWEKTLDGIAPGAAPAVWLPIFSNVPVAVDPRKASSLRERLASGRFQTVIGHFGAYGQGTQALAESLSALLKADSGRLALLIGAGGRELAEHIAAAWPELEPRLLATGELAPEELALHLKACDILLQPYNDGVSSRRGSLMAGLALGVPTVTNEGFLTEGFWAGSGAVVLVPRSDPAAMIAAAAALLADSDRRRELGLRGAALYQEKFALERTLTALRAAA